MAILALVENLRAGRRVAQHANEIARRAAPEVFQRVRLRLPEMALPEARGYIRAKGARILNAHLRELARRQPTLADEAFDRIGERAMAAVIEAVIDEHLRSMRHSYQRLRAA
jgi:hypothetical protein